MSKMLIAVLKELKERVVSRSTNLLAEVRSLLVKVLDELHRENVSLGTQLQLAVSFTVLYIFDNFPDSIFQNFLPFYERFFLERKNAVLKFLFLRKLASSDATVMFQTSLK